MISSSQAFFESIVEDIEEASLGKLFGKLCGKINRKAFVAFFEEEMVFKLGREEVEIMLKKYEGAKRWDPSKKGRPMKDWIQVPYEFKSDWKELAAKSIDYMS